PLGERLQLGPRDLWVYAPAEPAVGPRDDVLAADQARKALDAVGDELGVLDHVGRVTGDARDQDLPGRQLDVLPHAPLVLVANVAGLEGIGLAVHGQHDVHDVAHRDVGHVGAVPASPAEVEPDAIAR